MEIINSNPDCCIVSLFVHNVCNFNCSYCSDEHRDGSYRWPTNWDGYLDLIDEIKERRHYIKPSEQKRIAKKRAIAKRKKEEAKAKRRTN